MKTTPFSNITPEQVTRGLIAKARTIASGQGATQFGFRVAKGGSYHTMGYVDPTQGPAQGEYEAIGPIDEGDWVVRHGRWVLVR